MTQSSDSGLRMTEGRRDIVEVRDIDGETALCPAEAVLLNLPGGQRR